MAERIYHDQMNDKENPNDRDAFVPRNENGTYMDKSEAMNKLHREALRIKTTEDAAAKGRERIEALKKAAGSGAERCKNIWGGIRETVSKAVAWLKKLGVSAAGVGERVLGSDEYVKSAYDSARERAGGIREDLKQRAEAARDKCAKAGSKAVETGRSLWGGAVETVKGTIDSGRERIDGAKKSLKDRMNEMYANDMVAKAERFDNIAENEVDKAAQLLRSAQARRESADALRQKAKELAPQLFEEKEGQASPEAQQQAA